ncbi:hypothetical protein AB833_21210 [Chromatiales bacterium (ex Bugula neritina AB1)]|nr:hypothetical protein AB833_21210 [Chromatiales bacterium (ex Bugula neritina AB1)]
MVHFLIKNSDEHVCHLPVGIVVPDLAGWRKSTVSELPETVWFGVRPDWVCEVTSPATVKNDRRPK